MTLQDITLEELKKYDIDVNQKSPVSKYLSTDDRWNIVQEFFKQREIENAKITVNENSKMVFVNFENKEAAKKFAEIPSAGLAAYTRKWLTEKGENYRNFEIYFNIGVSYDEKDPKVNKRVTLWLER